MRRRKIIRAPLEYFNGDENVNRHKDSYTIEISSYGIAPTYVIEVTNCSQYKETDDSLPESSDLKIFKVILEEVQLSDYQKVLNMLSSIDVTADAVGPVGNHTVLKLSEKLINQKIEDIINK